MKKEEELETIMELDYRKEENKKIIQRELHKIKPFKQRKENIPIDDLEKLIFKLSQKYQNIWIKQIVPFLYNNHGGIYRAFIIELSKDESIKYHEIFACCIYELYAKMAIFIYAITRRCNDET